MMLVHVDDTIAQLYDIPRTEMSLGRRRDHVGIGFMSKPSKAGANPLGDFFHRRKAHFKMRISAHKSDSAEKLYSKSRVEY